VLETSDPSLASDEALEPSLLVSVKPEDTQPGHLVIDFGEGYEPIEVSFRRPRVMNPPYEPVGRLVDQYDTLATAARAGDGPAARMLYLELKTCDHFFKWQARASRVERNNQAAAHEEPEEAETRCVGVTEEHLSDYVYWAELAAQSRDYIGQQSFGAELGKTPEALAVFESFWNDGNASALPAMSSLHANGAASGEPDWVKAYAMHLIYFKLSEASQASIQSRGGTARRFTHTALGDHLSQLGGMLNPGQQQQAEALAHRLLAENANCCVGSF
jgi:hypothetical protein